MASDRANVVSFHAQPIGSLLLMVLCHTHIHVATQVGMQEKSIQVKIIAMRRTNWQVFL